MDFQLIVLIIPVRLITTMHEFTLAVTTLHLAGRNHLLDGGPAVQSTRSVFRLALALRARGQHRGRDDRQVGVGQRRGSSGRESRT